MNTLWYNKTRVAELLSDAVILHDLQDEIAEILCRGATDLQIRNRRTSVVPVPVFEDLKKLLDEVEALRE